VIAYNPATLEILLKCEETPPGQVAEIVSKARLEQNKWGALSFRERARQILHLRDTLVSRIDNVAESITKNTGKPIAESYTSEIFPTLYLINHFVRKNLPEQENIPIGFFGLMGRQSSIIWRPAGVVAIISPWNYPFAITLGNTVMALLAGCSVVIKPSEVTPLVTSMIEELLKEAGLPEGLVGVIYGGKEQARALIETRPDKVIFTGSVATGKKVMADCANRLIPVVLELGGKNPAVVLENAHLENAVRGIMWGGFTNSGQACASVGRAYIHKDIYDDFVGMLVEKTRTLRQGDPLDINTDIGALTTEAQLKRLDEMVKRSVSQGAQVLSGGSIRGPGYFFEPTVIANVKNDMEIMQEEIFGPVIPVMRFNDEEEAVRLANDSRFGLTASVWSQDLKRAERIARKFEAGTVVINDCAYTYGLCETPWGGVKDSGFGVTHSALGMLEFLHPLHINVNVRPKTKSMWWFPYNQDLMEASKGMIDFMFTRNRLGALKKLKSMLKRT
jgi:succinate-semialdehyde dehydrogenase/glutarate-semialdehyde dehydrogenase